MATNPLISQIAGLTGLDPEWVNRRLNKELSARGLDSQDVDMATLRTVLAELVQEVLLSAKQELKTQPERFADL
ncbi:MAG: hypothetical protein CL675_07520 [Bdellovibrionaceae bacterium]|nr:hypothetical protein [Pseudobdellovibrionaceae bacterium]|tara:strand:+ start:260 stop:481 length:222 start_codon:yes stop_codon:yes gene_type:complete